MSTIHIYGEYRELQKFSSHIFVEISNPYQIETRITILNNVLIRKELVEQSSSHVSQIIRNIWYEQMQ